MRVGRGVGGRGWPEAAGEAAGGGNRGYFDVEVMVPPVLDFLRFRRGACTVVVRHDLPMVFSFLLCQSRKLFSFSGEAVRIRGFPGFLHPWETAIV
jgi:hypothetical protein